jgi:hemerythrin
MQIHIAIYHPRRAGILSAAIDLKADKVILLHRQEDTVDGIKSVLNSRGIQCLSKPVNFETEQLRQDFAGLLEQYQSEDLYLNASSGYKKMVLIAFEQFNAYGYPIFMVDKFTDELYWLKNRANQPTDDHHLVHEIKIGEYLKSFNTHLLNQGSSSPEPQASRDLTAWLIEHIGHYDKHIAQLNYIAMMASKDNRYALDHHQVKNQGLLTVLDHFEAAGMLTLRGRKLKFSDSEARFYCNGGWLENHVFALTYGMRKKRSHITDIIRGLQVVRNNGVVKNEIDVAAMSHNRLHLIECKTRKFSKSNDDNDAANTAIYRLDSLKTFAGGLSSKAMLVSYQPLNSYSLSRAQDLGIYCCSHTQLKQLDHHLYRFFDTES